MRDNLLLHLFLTQRMKFSISSSSLDYIVVDSFSFRDYRLLISSIDDESIGNKFSYLGNLFHPRIRNSLHHLYMPVLFQSNKTETILCQGNVEYFFCLTLLSKIE